MDDILNFDDRLTAFRDFLAEQGHPTNIFWVFREDIWEYAPSKVLLRLPSPNQNLALAKKVYAEGCGKGLVDIHAIATFHDQVAATVWFPKFPEEEIQGWDCGIKLSVASPLPEVEVVGSLRWLSFRLNQQFRHYQRFGGEPGTRAWAAAPPAL